MKLARITATTSRILKQLRHDLRTVLLMLATPLIILIVLRLVFDGSQSVFTQFAPLMIGIMAFVVMFVVAAVATLRERQSGTLERLLVLPITRLEIISGYALAFGVVALLQAGLATGLVVYGFEITLVGSVWWLLLLGVLSGLAGMSLGLFLSDFASNEFQAVQFMPAFVLPQIILCGLFVPRQDMFEPLYVASYGMPITYIVEATQEIMAFASWTNTLSLYVLLLVLFFALSLLAAAVSMRTST